MSYALQAAILIQLEAEPDAMLTVCTLATRLAIDQGLVRDELETLWAFGQVVTVRDSPGNMEIGTIVGAMALPPRAELACA